MRFALFGDGRWAAACLEELMRLDHEPVLVIQRSGPTSSELSEVAARLGVATVAPPRVNVSNVADLLVSRDTELCVSVAYDQIFRQRLISAPRTAFVNCHAGLLPYYRGRNVINWAIINGEKSIGITVHHVDEGIDTGDIIVQESIELTWTDTYATVLSKVVEAIPRLLGRAVVLLDRGVAMRVPQSHLIGSYFGGRLPGDEDIDWSATSLEIYNKIRAISSPGPGARTRLREEILVVWAAEYDPGWPRYQATPGEVVGRHADGVRVKSGDSTIVLTKVSAADGDMRTPTFPIGTRFSWRCAACAS